MGNLLPPGKRYIQVTGKALHTSKCALPAAVARNVQINRGSEFPTGPTLPRTRTRYIGTINHRAAGAMGPGLLRGIVVPLN